MAKMRYKNADGNPIPGVTTIIEQDSLNLSDPANLAGLRGEVTGGARGSWTLKAAIGTVTHQKIQDDLSGTPFKPEDIDFQKLHASLHKDAIQGSEVPFSAYLAWKPGKDLRGRCEVSLVHPTLSYGGTIDLLQDEAILDWKTSSPSAFKGMDKLWAQVAGGYAMLAEAHGQTIKLGRIVRLPKEGTSAEEYILDMASPKAKAARELFLHLLHAYECRRIINQKDGK